MKVYNLTGCRFEDLYKGIDEGYLVIVWTTMYLKPSYESTTWKMDGQEFTWIAREHCMVLTGYDKSKGIVYVEDPLVGNTSYDSKLFSQRYEEMLCQAVTIK